MPRRPIAPLCLIGAATVLAACASGPPAADRQPAPSTDPRSLVGAWRVDLRPTPDAEPYYQMFIVERVTDNAFAGEFYNTPIEEARVNNDWGDLRFSFVTADAQAPYVHAGRLVDGRLEGMTNSIGRDFLAVWTAERVEAE